MVLGLAASVHVHTAGEDIVNLGEAETSVQGGAFEGRAISGEGYALWDHTKSETIKIDKYEGRTFTHIKPHHSYFGYFNQMIEAYSENDWGIMLGKRNGLNQSILLREIEIIVNRISKVFANIGFEYQPFQFETESEQLKEDNWIGRAWRCPNFIIRLEKLKGYANLCLIISPLAEQSAQTA